jgi:hypothetical protein
MQDSQTELPSRLTDKQRYWLDHIKSCEASGQTMVAYATEQGFDLKRFYNWKMRLRRLGVLPASRGPVAFKPVRVIASQDPGKECRIALPNGIDLQVTAGCDPRWLASIVKALGYSS